SEGNVWVSGRRPLVTWILRSATGTGTSAVPLRKQTISVPLSGAGAEAVGAGYLWVVPDPATSASSDDRVSVIDVRSHGVASSVGLGRQTTAIAFGYGSALIGPHYRRAFSDLLSLVRVC